MRCPRPVFITFKSNLTVPAYAHGIPTRLENPLLTRRLPHLPHSQCTSGDSHPLPPQRALSGAHHRPPSPHGSHFERGRWGAPQAGRARTTRYTAKDAHLSACLCMLQRVCTAKVALSSCAHSVDTDLGFVATGTKKVPNVRYTHELHPGLTSGAHPKIGPNSAHGPNGGLRKH